METNKVKVFRIYVGLTIQPENLPDIPLMGNECEFIKDKIHVALKDNGVQAYTIFEANGFWQGIAEPSICIEIISDSIPLKRICEDIKHECYQSSVIATVSEANLYEF